MNLTNHPTIVITGTDTGIGKTIYSGRLYKELSKNKTVITQKWVQSGDLDSPDVLTHDTIANQFNHLPKELINAREVYRFSTPASPHLAAAQESPPKRVKLKTLLQATKILNNAFDTVLVETSGGVMVPLNESETMLDAMTALGAPTIVVAPNRLGAINHALLTLNMISQRNIPILGFVINNFFDCPTDIQIDNPRIIQSLSGIPLISTIASLPKEKLMQ